MLPLKKIAIDALTQLDNITGLMLTETELTIVQGNQNMLIAHHGSTLTVHTAGGAQKGLKLAGAYKAIGLKKANGKKTETDETNGNGEGTE